MGPCRRKGSGRAAAAAAQQQWKVGDLVLAKMRAVQIRCRPNYSFGCRLNAVTQWRCSYDSKLPLKGAPFGSFTPHNPVASIYLQKLRSMAMVTSQAQELERREFCYMFRSERGDLVKVVVVGAKGVNFVVHIEVLSGFEDQLLLSYETSRSASSQMVADAIPFFRNSSRRYTLDLVFDSRNAPFYLSFLLHFSSDAGAVGPGVTTHRKTNFCVPVGLGPGYPCSLGVSISDDGMVNFALFSRSGKSVILCLYDGNTEYPSLEIELDPYVNRTGDVWHVSLESIGDYVSYGYRCKGSVGKGGGFHEQHVLLDPYARMVGNLLPDEGKPMAATKFLGSLKKETIYDWGGDAHPRLRMEELVVYRLNVRQFTKDKSSGLPEDIAGTFTGVRKKVQHFKGLGVNAVLLEPVFPFDVQKGPYFPYHFFSVTDGYGQEGDASSSISSMKEMIKTLHAEGIEVLMEVVFTHIGEGGDGRSQLISFSGIDSSSYVFEGNTGSQISSLKCYNPIVQKLIIDSLRHWVVEFHLDGFCFVNSSLMARGEHGEHLSRPPLLEAIAFDPVLSKTKIIADCWSPLDRHYVEIQFPHWRRWAEMNMKFCTDVRNFLRGKGLLSDFATRLCGSADLFSSRGPAFSFNFVTKNFGLPLVDLVSYGNSKLASELSWNCGDEGPTNKNTVLETRLKQIRNFLFILFVSLGVPVLNMGDEFGYSTGGSPLYNDRQSIDWSILGTGFGMQITQFIAYLSSLRMRHNDIFQRKHFLKVENIVWYGSNQAEPQWDDPTCKILAMALKSERNPEMSSSSNGDLFICFNASNYSETVILPQRLEGNVWLRLVDTSLAFPMFFSNSSDSNLLKVEGLSSYELKPHSCALFEAQRITT
ncbi:isoamylase 2, chloroplastic-like [Canna indica]|uniref:Isoamylase 2, chloroplastic-like n=1 Tax=Canna indica TaxID=4628 RepID=A0AAQ3K5X4_9LILI|nr:isoamylase 2, chloroplastic-like [Canna indica]